MERPLFLPLLATVVGVLLADLFLYFVPDLLLYLSLAATLPFLFLKRRALFFAALSLFFFSWGNLSLKPFLLQGSSTQTVLQMLTDDPVTVEGVIESRPETSEKGSRLYLRAERVYREKSYAIVTGRILLFVAEGKGELYTGDRIRFISRIKAPRNFGLPGEFDYVRYLAYRHVYCTAFVKSSKDLLLMRKRADYSLQNIVDALAADFGRFINRCAPGEEGYILQALLLGDMGGVSKSTKDAYTRTGVNHILSISGFHISIVVFFIFHLLLLLARSSEFLLLQYNMRRLILIFTIPVVIFYLLLSGGAPATVRSVIMVVAFITAMLLGRDVDPLNSLMLAAMVIIVGSPPVLFDLSFQLSFLALWGIVVLTPLFIAPFRNIEGTLWYKLLLFLMVSAAATCVTLLPVAYNFHRTTLTGLISNFFIVPLIGYGAVVLGFSALPFIYIVPSLARLLLVTAALLVQLSNFIINLLAQLPLLPLLNPTRFDLLLFFVFLVMLTFVRRNRMKLVCCSSVTLIYLVVKLITPPVSGDDGLLAITFFSLGQGESTLISFPNGKKMLIDGGGTIREGGMDPGERLLAPALWRMGVERLDYVVLSHSHPDHLNGLKFILANFDVGEFWESGIPSSSEDYINLKRLLAARQIPVRSIHAAIAPVDIGETKIEPLAPFLSGLTPKDYRNLDLNESSLVFRLKYGDFSLLFTGDIGSVTEGKLLLRPEYLPCVVLKVPHHGSSYSSTLPFLSAASPKVALISAGYKNSFGLPSRQTTLHLDQMNVKVYRTDLDGTVRLSCGKNGYEVSTFYASGHFR
ncbi:MAG: DNA internalization-related competence protein ComEC/Rec2 [Deltaproteobacteria bacterium]